MGVRFVPHWSLLYKKSFGGDPIPAELLFKNQLALGTYLHEKRD